MLHDTHGGHREKRDVIAMSAVFTVISVVNKPFVMERCYETCTDPRRHSKRFPPRRRAGGAGRQSGHWRGQCTDGGRPIRPCRRDAGLAPARPRELRGESSWQKDWRDDRPRRTAAGALARALRAEHERRGAGAGPPPL